MVTQLKIKAKENIDKGIIKIPHYNFCQDDELAPFIKNTKLQPQYLNKQPSFTFL